MARPFNLSANPLRLFLALALLLLGALLVGFSVNQPPIHTAGSRSQPAAVFVTAPNAGSQPAAGTAANQSTSATTQIVTRSGQGPAVSAPPAAAEQLQPAPAGAPGCQMIPAGGRDIAATCANP
jgi:hypothetical protein